MALIKHCIGFHISLNIGKIFFLALALNFAPLPSITTQLLRSRVPCNHKAFSHPPPSLYVTGAIDLSISIHCLYIHTFSNIRRYTINYFDIITLFKVLSDKSNKEFMFYLIFPYHIIFISVYRSK